MRHDGIVAIVGRELNKIISVTVACVNERLTLKTYFYLFWENASTDAMQLEVVIKRVREVIRRRRSLMISEMCYVV